MSANLATRYLGMQLRSPVVPSASPMGQRVDSLKQLQDSGVGAVVLPSLFEEQIEHDEMQFHGVLDAYADSNPEGLTYFPEFEDYNTGADAYVRHVEACKRELEIPVIASLNGISQGGWVGQARRLQEAGADALELNVYFLAADPDETADDVEMRYVKLVEAVRGEISIPLAVKIGPFFSSIGHMAHRLVASGADGLVLFNRFMQPDIDLEELRIDPILHLSTSAGAAAATAVDRDPPRPHPRIARAHDRGAYLVRCAEGIAGGGRRRDDGERPPARGTHAPWRRAR